MAFTKIHEVQMYETEDGKKFDTRAEAEQYLTKLELTEKIDRDIYCRDTSAEEIAEWIVENLNFALK